jgi:hypothetical protein
LITNATVGKGAVFSSRPAGGTSTTAWEAQGVVIVAESGNSHISVTAYAVCTA